MTLMNVISEVIIITCFVITVVCSAWSVHIRREMERRRRERNEQRP
jgi:ABC-type transport system involved in Fe-S cluster assembly fused permease/ATPase subunit